MKEPSFLPMTSNASLDQKVNGCLGKIAHIFITSIDSLRGLKSTVQGLRVKLDGP
jgi:hypothetical protein